MPFSGSVNRKASLHRGISGALGTISGLVTKKTQYAILGALGALSGAISWGIGTVYKDVSGILSDMSGSLSRRYYGKRNASGGLSTSGDVSRKLTAKRSVVGTLSFTGSAMDNLLEIFYRSVSGVLGSLSGIISAVYHEGGKAVSAGLNKLGFNLNMD